MKNIITFLAILCTNIHVFATEITVVNQSGVPIYVSIHSHRTCANHSGPIAINGKDDWTIYGCPTDGKIWFSDKIYASFDTSGDTNYVFTANKDEHGYYVDVKKQVAKRGSTPETEKIFAHE